MDNEYLTKENIECRIRKGLKPSEVVRIAIDMAQERVDNKTTILHPQSWTFDDLETVAKLFEKLGI